MQRTAIHRLLRILLVHSAKDLFRYKSFLFLVFFLVLADRALKRIVPMERTTLALPDLQSVGAATARYVFEALPGQILGLLSDHRTFLTAGALFLLKQLISMWPSSDMRRMHRQERGSFGLLTALLTIRRDQILWDAIAVSTICLLLALWSSLGFLATRILWQIWPHPAGLLLLLMHVGVFLPLVLAGFSYSSKLAVISQGSFRQKLDLFLRLFRTPNLLAPSWLFFSVRIGLEGLFVVLLPAAILLYVKTFWLRILAATLLATPVYSYLKMASFKFFLEIYRPYRLVRQEYASYYAALDRKA
ncbi:MAG: hypothetical protein QNJ22_01135 [Desulfosarcinaceae bacterium]|nr:hypothetical protein [Desulfosarcinaceae bacterium]